MKFFVSIFECCSLFFSFIYLSSFNGEASLVMHMQNAPMSASSMDQQQSNAESPTLHDIDIMCKPDLMLSMKRTKFKSLKPALSGDAYLSSTTGQYSSSDKGEIGGKQPKTRSLVRLFAVEVCVEMSTK